VPEKADSKMVAAAHIDGNPFTCIKMPEFQV
jgi:hypothetical protein